jgi:mersacidin/lichenicidin family type 2 lantibiotic
MSHDEIIRAWKDPEYRMSLSEEERSRLPENPAGVVDVTDGEMDAVVGGGLNVNFLAGILGANGTCGSHHQCCPQPTKKPKLGGLDDSDRLSPW